MRERNAVRVVPRSAVTVAIANQGLSLAYGVVADISEAGACVWTNGLFKPGEALHLKLSFANEPQPFQASGRLVWIEPRRAGKGVLRCGVQWAPAGPSPKPGRLRTLIDTSS